MADLRDKKLFLLDMDGTIYLDDCLFDGVPDFLARIRAVGGRYLFLTNNSSRGVEGYIPQPKQARPPHAVYRHRYDHRRCDAGGAELCGSGAATQHFRCLRNRRSHSTCDDL